MTLQVAARIRLAAARRFHFFLLLAHVYLLSEVIEDTAKATLIGLAGSLQALFEGNFCKV
ncbi:hypothetical protein [Microbacterium enclense]|uniref:hypothetical protein n=1 Tax=Microbacterium enclense TaxID=993073 RepID=UPI003417E53C